MEVLWKIFSLHVLQKSKSIIVTKYLKSIFKPVELFNVRIVKKKSDMFL